MGHDIEAARAKAEASFRKPDQSGESTIAQAQREVREQIERLIPACVRGDSWVAGGAKV